MVPIALVDRKRSKPETPATCEELVESGDLEVTISEAAEAARVIGLFDWYHPRRAVVVPPRTPAHATCRRSGLQIPSRSVLRSVRLL
jgi:hypothetical protein